MDAAGKDGRLGFDDGARPERIAGDVVPFVLRGHAECHARHAELGDHVRDFAGRGSERELRAHIEDVPPLLADHVRQRVIAGDIGGAGVDLHHEVETLGRRLQDGLHPDGAGVVDQNVEAAEFGHGALDTVANGVFVADVGGDGERAPAEGADGIGGLMNAAGEALGGLFTFGGHGDIGAFLGEADGQSPADAAAGPGDHGHAAAQVGMKNGFGLVHTKTKVITSHR